MEGIIIFIDSLIMSWIAIYVGTKLLENKIEYRTKKYWFYYFLYVLYVFISYMITDNFIRVVLIFILISFIFHKLYKITIVKGIVTGFFVSIYTFIAELFFVLVIASVFRLDIDEYSKIYLGNIITNISIALIMYGMTKIERISKYCRKIIFKVDANNKKIFLIFSILSLISFSLLLYYIYFDINLIWSLVLCIILIVIFIIITFGLFYEKIHNDKLKSEYDLLLDNLTEYEKMYSLQRKKNHENKNDLLIIKGMISKDNKEAIKYINELVKIKEDKKQNWMEFLKKIPEGGLRGILYYKLLEIEKNKIKFQFSTSTKYSIKSYSKLTDDVKVKICKLLGIYLDNAIQAVINLEEKNIYLSIDETKEKIIFKIANNFSGSFDLDKIYEEGYTTKGKGHGYGLSIAKKILEDENRIMNKTSIIKDKFIQEIYIRKIL